MAPLESEQIQMMACALHARFDDQSPFWFTTTGNGDVIRFLGLSDGKAAVQDVRLKAEPGSLAHWELKTALVRTLRRLDHDVYGETDDMPVVLFNAVKARKAEGKSIH